jgi:hypothetical protein
MLAPMQREIAATYLRLETTAKSRAATGNDDGAPSRSGAA